jgi:hypothetical protein
VQRQQPVMLWWHVGTPSCARGVVWSVLNAGVAHLPGHARTQGPRGHRGSFQVPEAKRKGRTSVLRTRVHRLRATRRRALQREKPHPPSRSSDAAVLSSSRTPKVTSLLRARCVMSGTLLLIAASSQPRRTHHPCPTPVLLTPLTREVVAGGCCRYIRLHFLRKRKASDPLPTPPKVPHPRPRLPARA